jgi:hypothetical protein
MIGKNVIDKKVSMVVGIQLLIALVFISGVGRTNQSIRNLYHSYFADIALPFGLYFLLSLNESRHAFLRPWRAKALAVFALCAGSETLQFFGIYALARVFDPLDFVMYGLGVLAAAAVDRVVLARSFSFWVDYHDCQ